MKNLARRLLAGVAVVCLTAGMTAYASESGTEFRGGTAGDVIRLPEAIRADGGAYEFKGWSLNGDEGTLYQAGDEVAVNKELAKDADTLTFTAEWEKKIIKYAVAIYGINQDVDQSGKYIPLTFGPATGADYTQSFNACAGTSEGNPTYSGHKCLHWMTWNEIIDQANKDPNVFLDCLKNGCTHSVELSFGDSPLKGSETFPNMSGDGASILYYSLNENYRKWNNERSNTGGWPASRIRTTLNGSDKCSGTDPSVAGTDLLTESQALISAFPEELRNAIVPKAVKSDIVYKNENAGNVKTTYDKLWLFSGRELRTGDPKYDVRKNESNVSTGYYQRASELGISRSSYAKLEGYNESGSSHWWWLRSPGRSSSYGVYSVNGSGDWNSNYADNADFGAAPGFCLGKVQ